jgi:hypothetical protein
MYCGKDFPKAKSPTPVKAQGILFGLISLMYQLKK